jgi:hypothetical protein
LSWCVETTSWFLDIIVNVEITEKRKKKEKSWVHFTVVWTQTIIDATTLSG